MIGVKNNLEKDVVGRYNGVDYIFKAGKTTATPEEAATHIFGYGLDDKKTALLRLGWVGNSMSMDEAMERLGQIQFLAEKEPVFEEPKPLGLKTAPPQPQGSIKAQAGQK